MRTLRDFLKASIENEKKILQLYEQGRQTARQKTTKKCLSFLIEDEAKHIKILESILENELYDLDCNIPNDKVFLDAVAAYGELKCHCKEDSTVEEILEAVLEREQHAKRQYEALANICTVEEVATLLRNMAKEDEDHFKLIEKEYKKRRGLLGEEF